MNDDCAQAETVGSRHAREAGALCRDGGDGCCSLCGVAMTECEECHGIGYHRTAPSCPYIERNGEGAPY